MMTAGICQKLHIGGGRGGEGMLLGTKPPTDKCVFPLSAGSEIIKHKISRLPYNAREHYTTINCNDIDSQIFVESLC